MRTPIALCILGASFIVSIPASAGVPTFVNWENAQIHPLDMTPDGTRLLAVNTADNRLLVFDVSSGVPSLVGDVPVGLDPVTVRARTNDEAWVVNHISDTISVVRLNTMNVVATLETADEPCDVVFAGAPLRAYVSCSQANTVQVFDPANLAAAPVDVPINAEDPRAMAVSPDGSKVYVAVFESGNRSTILAGGNAGGQPGFFPPNAVSHPAGPYAGQNPPPNAGAVFSPAINPALPTPPPVGLIVKKSAAGQWMDDNGGDWTEFVSGGNSALSGRPAGWDLLDHDVAVIETSDLQVSYLKGLMNLCMSVAVNPASGQIAVVGTDGTNEIRFEPNLNGRFLRVNVALVDPAQPNAPQIIDLNPHLNYAGPTIPMAERELSIGDPRGIVWNAAGNRAYVTGMGSNNLVIVDTAGVRAGLQPTIELGEGPTGVVLDGPRERLYVLNKFEGSISVIDTALEIELVRVGFFDPTPAAIKTGRKHLFGTHETSGLGHLACASCHPDSRMDRLAWDLGDPTADMFPFDQNCNFGSFGGPPESLGPPPCPDWHPMKGPMVTQTLVDIIGKEPHHWRGDRDGIEEFNQTFTNLQGRPELLTASEMQEFEDFLASVTIPPNPFRNFDNSLSSSVPLPGHFYTGLGGAPGVPLPAGDAAGLGEFDFNEHHTMPGIGMGCSFCHTTPTGVATNDVFDEPSLSVDPFPLGPNGEMHHAVVFAQLAESPALSIKVPQLRNLHEKVGFDLLHTTSRAGFGFMHDGSVDTLSRFLSEPFFIISDGLDAPPSQLVPALTAFLLSFSGSDLLFGDGQGVPPGMDGPLSQDSHAAVGAQLTFDGSNNDDADSVALLNNMIAVADAQQDFTPGPLASLVAKGVQNGEQRGYSYAGNGRFQSDRAEEARISPTALKSAAAAGSEITFTVVPRGTQTRIGIDRDEDGSFDRDELDSCGDPADALVLPAGRGDLNLDGAVDFDDVPGFVDAVLAVDGTTPQEGCLADMNIDGAADGADVPGFVVCLISAVCP